MESHNLKGSLYWPEEILFICRDSVLRHMHEEVFDVLDSATFITAGNDDRAYLYTGKDAAEDVLATLIPLALNAEYASRVDMRVLYNDDSSSHYGDYYSVLYASRVVSHIEVNNFITVRSTYDCR